MDDVGVEVFPVWHTHEVLGDDVTMMIGVYTTLDLAHAAARRAASRPGFRDTVEGFSVGAATLGERLWTEGFVSIGADE